MIIDVGFAVEKIWEQQFTTIETKKEKWERELSKEVKWWREGVEELMSWLGWAGNWARCEKQCGWDEKCYIPMWPMIGGNRMPGRGRSPGGDGPHRGPPDGGGGESPGDGPPPPPPGEREPFLENDERQPPPGYKPPGRRPGRGGGPGWMVDESDLWEPKCIKVDYIMGNFME